ncbi:ModE family transcriptional regulator [Sphingobium sp. SCG-1]|uniref:winged helix-turn-helix domain-containing protein n=1 Tax=Sphingobium sp. SCG-1 TaxID=2072936 RepID=UPI000CD6C240|nr:LysR family transcriptional regulator [Sphingobium sp. SCG-1]AUW56758.1 ModE family transcriptional regulator [Sphingobium sp. SCG-1]
MQIDILKVKAQLLCGGEFAMGPGKADLLEAIERERSISGAGRALSMSYRRTWLLVDSMNRCWKEKLIDTIHGGGKERGARLTETGRAVLKAYRALEAEIAQSVQGEALDMLRGFLRDEPLPRQPMSEHISDA